MKYSKTKRIQITFTIRESLYFKFKTFCKLDQKMPTTILNELIKKYVNEKEKCLKAAEKNIN